MLAQLKYYVSFAALLGGLAACQSDQATTPIPSSVSASGARAAALSRQQTDFVSILNKDRTSGMKCGSYNTSPKEALIIDDKLMAAAQQYAEDIATGKAHGVLPNECESYVAKAGYTAAVAFGATSRAPGIYDLEKMSITSIAYSAIKDASMGRFLVCPQFSSAQYKAVGVGYKYIANPPSSGRKYTWTVILAKPK